MKKFLSAVLAAAMVLSLTACAGSDTSSQAASATSATVADTTADTSAAETTAQTETEAAPAETADAADDIDYASLSDEEIYNLMVERSLMTTGDMTRMANVLKKAQNGEEITVAYIGGSITEGLTAGAELCWARLSYEWLCEKYPDTKINYVNAGISGTPSVLGNIRLDRDVLASEPDIVFVEFAVNDGTDTIYKNSYESMVRTLLTNDKDIAVVLLFTVIKSGHTCQPHMSQIGENYGLPMISLPDSIGKEFADGRMTWEDYSDDESHPNVYGHTILRDFVANYFEAVIPQVDDNVGTVDKTLPDPVFSDRYQNMHFMDSASMTGVELSGFAENEAHASFKNGWMYKGDGGASMKFTLNCKTLEMVYKAQNSAMYGTADIYVDGEKVTSATSNQADGWNNPVTAMLIDNETAAEHTVEIRVEGGENCCFFVLGFGYCE